MVNERPYDDRGGDQTSDQASDQGELDDWFMVLLGPWGREDQPDGDPAMAEIPRRFLRRLRENAAEWQQLGVDADETIGCYEDERLRVGIELGDPDADADRPGIGVLRMECSTGDWQAAWVDPDDGITAGTMTDARPRSEFTRESITSTDGAPEITEALDWLRTQLTRHARSGDTDPCPELRDTNGGRFR